MAGITLLAGASGVFAADGGTAADTPPAAVEDFQYPGADQVLKDHGIVLKQGDGHIMLADCASEPGLLEVWARGMDKFCLKVTGNGGYLTMDVPKVYGIKGNSYTVRANMTVDNTDASFDITKDTWTPVGETADSKARDHNLVQLTATK
ncbi:hypothetical protein [Kitasatospora kazusensis]|uniref:hypothetical protein n=1 Tax=Kitasatospora kazusensis TaxID=407974 RepID=UPI0031DD7302